MAIKMRGVVAAPGEYKYGETIEIKTEEELKKDAQKRPFVPLTYGHVQPVYDEDSGTWVIDPELIIGSVYRKWSKRDNRVNAKVNFHEEKTPEVLKQKIDNGEKIPISAGIFLDSVDDDKIQRGIETTHIAVLEGEDPTCPLDVCGFDIREESGGRIRRLEQQTDLEAPPAEKETEASPEETEEAPTETEKVSDIKEVKTEPTADPEQPKPEEVPEAEISPEVSDEEPEVEETPLVPETVIPASTPVAQKPYEVIDGNYVFVPEIFKQKQEKK